MKHHGGSLRLPWAQAFVSVNWVLAEEPLDLATELGLEFLDFLLVRSLSCPLSSCMRLMGHRLQGE